MGAEASVTIGVNPDHGCGSTAHHRGEPGPWVREYRTSSGNIKRYVAAASEAIGVNRDVAGGYSVTIEENPQHGCGSVGLHRAICGSVPISDIAMSTGSIEGMFF